MKKCGKCKIEKEVTEFNKNQGYCISCKKTYSKKYIKSYVKTEAGKQTANKWLKKTSGVYGIFENGKCLYVGESERVNGRIAEHRTNIKRFQQKTHKHLYDALSQHKHVIFGVLEETPNHKEREQYWINKLKPKYNGTTL